MPDHITEHPTDTDAASTTPPTGPDAAETPSAAPDLEAVWLDPNDVELESNVRDRVDTESADFADLVASIREHGVLQAVSALRYGDGTVKVVHGQRRVLAAREAGATLPALVAVDTAINERQRVFDRITGQIDENDVRTGITDGQRAAGIARLFDVKVPQRDILKRLPRFKRDELKASAKIGKSQIAREAIDSGQLSLEQAVVVAAFDAEGDTTAVQRLLDAPAYRFRYVANCIVEERAEARERADASAPWAQQGFTVLETDPDTSGGGWVHVDRLEHSESGEPATIDVVHADPGKWGVFLTVDEGGHVVVNDTGEVIDADLVDWSTEGTDPDVAAAEGRYRVDAVTISDGWRPDYYTLDPAAAGLQVAPAQSDTAPDGGGDAPSMAERLVADKRERERAERRKVITLNRAGAAAKATRIEWLRSHLTRKTQPPTAPGFVAASLAADSMLLNQNRAKATAVELLGIDADKLAKRGRLSEFVAGLTPNRANVIVLALVLGAFEARCEKDFWRSASESNGILGYLRFLAGVGYPLTPIDQVAAGDLDADDLLADNDDGSSDAGDDTDHDLAA